ncbi:LOW QUALITY PROTEIN: hypothetical protein HID58_066565 [Brassica napus]|uniref:Uncharacterized protein n=1 Tax=Brassica napus TaxID=3708 RepID=A0ABQ7ZGH9_BRANA|nr:LOW QUALITY PROTEIN: hypothetical protein HID58_066565 [Brassica napus]
MVNVIGQAIDVGDIEVVQVLEEAGTYFDRYMITNAFETSSVVINPDGFDVQDYLRLPTNELALSTVTRDVVKPKGKKRQIDKWSLYPERSDDYGETRVMLLDTVAEPILGASAVVFLGGSLDEVEDPEDLPDVINDLIGKTYKFGVYVNKDNVDYGADIFAIGKTWGADEIITEDDDTLTNAVSSDRSSGPVSLISIESENNTCLSSTPLSKRRVDSDLDDISSTSKKQCFKIIKVEKNNGEMKRKHPTPTRADHRKRSQTQYKQKPVADKTRDVPLSTVFPRLLNDIRSNFASRFQAQTASNPTNKRGSYIIYWSYVDILSFVIIKHSSVLLFGVVCFDKYNNCNPNHSQRSLIQKGMSYLNLSLLSTSNTIQCKPSHTTRNSGTSKVVVTEHELPNDDQENEAFQATMDEHSDLEFECSSQEQCDTDTSDDEQPSIDLEPVKDNQSDRVSFLAALFKKNFSEPKAKVKPVSPKEDG